MDFEIEDVNPWKLSHIASALMHYTLKKGEYMSLTVAGPFAVVTITERDTGEVVYQYEITC